MQYKCALIAVKDMEKSVRFYRDLLSQEIEFDFGENVAFKGGFALHLSSHFESLISLPVKRKCNSFELYFEDDNLEIVRDRLVEQSCHLVNDICEQPWRQKVLRVYDPDENIVEIGETMQHLCFRLHTEQLSNEEISEISNMPLEFVKYAITSYKY